MVFLLNRTLTQNRILIPTHPQIYWKIIGVLEFLANRSPSEGIGSDEIGSDRTRPVRIGSVRTEPVRIVSVRTGPIWLGCKSIRYGFDTN